MRFVLALFVFLCVSHGQAKRKCVEALDTRLTNFDTLPLSEQNVPLAFTVPDPSMQLYDYYPQWNMLRLVCRSAGVEFHTTPEDVEKSPFDVFDAGFFGEMDWTVKQIRSLAIDPIRALGESSPENIDQMTKRLTKNLTLFTRYLPNDGGPASYETNLNLLRTFLDSIKDVQPSKNEVVFTSYEQISTQFIYPKDTNARVRTAIEAVWFLWNDPARVIHLMKQIKDFLVRAAQDRPDVSAGTLIEEFRQSFEKQNGFKMHNGALVINDMDYVISTPDWHSTILIPRILTRDQGGDHAFGKIKLHAQNVHRNQMLLVMMDMNDRPEAYAHIKAGELYEALGQIGLNSGFTSTHLDPKNRIGFGLGFNNPFAVLFDNVPPGRDRSYSHASNPFYFHEIWMRLTGLGPTD